MEYFDPNKYVGGSKKSSTNTEKKSSTKLFDPMQYVDKSFIEEQQKQKQIESTIANATNKNSTEFGNEIMNSAKPKYDFTQTPEQNKQVAKPKPEEPSFWDRFNVVKRVKDAYSPERQAEIQKEMNKMLSQTPSEFLSSSEYKQKVKDAGAISSGVYAGATSPYNAVRGIVNATSGALGGDKDLIKEPIAYKTFKDARQEVMNNRSFVENIPEQMARSITEMIPAIALGGTPGLAYVGGQSGGQNAQQALDEGATGGQALTHGAITGAAEAIYERLFGFIPGVKNIFGADDIAKTFTGSTARNVAKGLANVGKKSVGEGLEEVLMEPTAGLSQKFTYDPSKAWTGQGGVFDPTAMAQAGVLGTLVGGVMGGSSIPSMVSQSKTASNVMRGPHLDNIINVAFQMPTQSKSFQVAQNIAQKPNVTYNDYVTLVNEIKSDSNVGLDTAQSSAIADRDSIIQGQMDAIKPVKLGKLEGQFKFKNISYENAMNKYDAAVLYVQDKYGTNDIVGAVSDIVNNNAPPTQRQIQVTPEYALNYIKQNDGIDMMKLADNIQKSEGALNVALDKEIARMRRASGVASPAQLNIVESITQKRQLLNMLKGQSANTQQDAIRPQNNFEGNFTPQQQENAFMGESDASIFSGGTSIDNAQQNNVNFTLGEQKQIKDAGRKAYTTALQQKATNDITRKQIEQQANIKKVEAENNERNRIIQSKQGANYGTQSIQEPALGRERQADSNGPQSTKTTNEPENTSQFQKNAVEGVKNYSPNTDVSGVKVVENETSVQKSSREFINSTLGLNVVFFEGAKDAPNGFYLPKDPTTLYINSDNSDTAIARSVSHESFHALKKNDPAKWNELVDYLSENLEQKQFADYANSFEKQEYTKFLMDNQKVLIEEIAADEFANNFTDKTWWEELYNKNTSLFKKLMFFINKFLDKINAVEAKANNYLTTKQAQAFAKKQMEIMESVIRGKGVNVPSKNDNTNTNIETNTNISIDINSEKLSDRTFDSVGDRSVKSYTQMNPVLSEYVQDEAQRLLNELKSTIRGEKIFKKDEVGYIIEVSGVKKRTSKSLQRIWDAYNGKITYAEIEKGLKNIISGNSNNALSKRIELIIDDNLTDGTVGLRGEEIPKNEEYIELKSLVEGTEYKQSPERQLEILKARFNNLETLLDNTNIPLSLKEGYVEQAQNLISEINRIENQINNSSDDLPFSAKFPNTEIKWGPRSGIQGIENQVSFSGRRIAKDGQKIKKLYHGGGINPKEYSIEKASDSQFGTGFYATDGYGVAEEWAEERSGKVYDVELDVSNFFDEFNVDYSNPKYQKLKDLLVAEIGLRKEFVDDNFGGSGTLDFFAERVGRTFPNKKRTMFQGSEKIKELLQKAGFDGAIAQFRDSKQYVAYNPSEQPMFSGRRIAKDELAVKIELQDIVTDELKNAKDPKGMFAPSRLRLDSAQRVFERYFGKDSKAMKILQGGKTAEADMIRWQSETIKKIKDLNIKSNLYFIPGKKFLSKISKESQALMWYAEKMKGLDPYSIDELKADLPDTWQKIVDAEKVIREIYDSTIKLANQKREALGYPPIPFRKNYIAHMQQANGLFEMFGVSGSDVPTAIAGMTDEFEPWKPFFANEFRRVTNETEVDAIGNTIRYINGIGRMIYMTEYINSMRMLEKGVRENYSQHQVITEIEKINELMKDREASGRARFSKYYEEEQELAKNKPVMKNGRPMTDNARQKRLAEVQRMKIKAVNETNEALKDMKQRKDKFEELLAGMSKEGDSATHLSILAGWLKEYTNLVAGKNARIDRITEELVRRKGYSWYQVIDRQLSSAYVGYNVGSATTNVIPLVNALSQINKFSVAKGMFDAVRYWNNADGLLEKSDFLSKRLIDTSFTNTMWGKAIDYGFVLMRLVDKFASSTIFRAKYYEGLGQGKTEVEAIKQANTTAEKIMADRSATNVPVLFKSKLANIVVKFQLEQINNLQNILGDNFKTDWSKDPGKLGKQLAEKNPATYNVLRSTYNLLNYFALAYVLNLGFLALLGRKPAFDLIGLFQDLMKIFGDEKETEGEKTWKAVKKFIEQIPFAQILTGGRVPLGGALPNVEDIIRGKSTLSTEIKKPAKLLLPGGGGQISKTIEGINTVNREGYYKNTPSGEALQYSVEKTPANMAKAAVFGRSSLPETRKFYEEGGRALNAKQTIEQKAIGLSPEDYLTGRNLQTELGKAKTRVDNEKIKTKIVETYKETKDPTIFIATLDKKLSRTVKGDKQEVELTDAEYQEYIKNIIEFSKKIRFNKATARTYDRISKILNEYINRQNKKFFAKKAS